MPRPASSCSSTPTTPAFASASGRIAERRETALREGLARAGVDTLELATDDDLVDAILRFADLRKQRSRLANWSGARLGAPVAREARGMSAARDPFMTFLWPNMLWAMAARAGADRALRLARHAAQEDDRCATPTWAWCKRGAWAAAGAWRRHVPPVLLLLALSALLFAASRPAALITLPSAQETIVLAMDVSGSMRAADVQPNRLVAAQEAAKTFVAELPRNVQGRGRLVRRHRRGGAGADPEPRRRQRGDRPLPAAARHRHRQRHRPFARHHLPRGGHRPVADHRRAADAAAAPNDKPKPDFTPVAPGSYSSAAIILLTDGQRTTGPDSLEAAKMAADRGVRVYTVGIGTKEGETIGFEGWSMRVRLDEETLKAIAKLTNADYFYAGTAADLKKVYQGLSTRLVVERKETEISALLAAIGALLVVLAAGLSVWWFGRIA